MNKENLINFIKKELSYDGGGGEDCPFCHKNIKPHRYWIDHKSELAGKINIFLGFKSGSWDDDKTEGMIFNTINEIYEITGNNTKDSYQIGTIIWNLFYE